MDKRIKNRFNDNIFHEAISRYGIKKNKMCKVIKGKILIGETTKELNILSTTSSATLSQ